MSRPVLVAPSILSADFGRLGEEVNAVEKAGADWIHVDVMDGHFVPNITIGPAVVASLKKYTSLPLDVHLMINNADTYIPSFAEAGADIITVHIEASPHLHRTLELIKSLGKKAGVSINPHTPVSLLEEVFGEIDLVLIMSVNPGFGGQKFIKSTLDKATLVRGVAEEVGFDIDIEMDGGIKPENAKEVIDAGVNVLVSGSGVFKSSDYKKAISGLKG